MKTMTCRELGGPCDVPHRGTSADDVIKAQDKHLKEVVAEGDQVHHKALKAMRSRWRRPISAMAWYKQTKRRFAELPDEGSV